MAVPYRERLKSLFSKGQFGDEFIEAAKKELPDLWGREALLEEFYALSVRGGDSNRIPQLIDQLGQAKQFHGSALRKLWHAVTG